MFIPHVTNHPRRLSRLRLPGMLTSSSLRGWTKGGALRHVQSEVTEQKLTVHWSLFDAYASVVMYEVT